MDQKIDIENKKFLEGTEKLGIPNLYDLKHAAMTGKRPKMKLRIFSLLDIKILPSY